MTKGNLPKRSFLFEAFPAVKDSRVSVLKQKAEPRTKSHKLIQNSGGSLVRRIIIIVGPNASGKSDLGVKIAKKVDGEVISADSRQVYRGMDIGTGKITKKEMRGVPHHLLDVASPKSEFNVSHFKKLATRKIEEIANRDCVPIMVGGTGFWIDALIYDWPIPEVGPNRMLRARLEKWPSDRLFAKLQKLDPARAASIKDRNEINNKRRLIRALEIVLTSGQPSPKLVLPNYYDPVKSLRDHGVSRNKKEVKIGNRKYRVLILGIKLPQKKLEKRIYKRLIQRLGSDMIEETKKLHKSGVSWKRLDNFGLEYRYVSRYLRGLLNYDQMIELLYSATKKYAKRQMTWFKRNPQIQWIPRNANLRMRASLAEDGESRRTNAANQKIFKQAMRLVKKFTAD